MLTSSPKVRLIGEHAHTKISRARGALLNAALIQELLGIPSYSHRVRSSDGSVMSVRAQEDGGHTIEIQSVREERQSLRHDDKRVCFYIDATTDGCAGALTSKRFRVYIAKVSADGLTRGHSCRAGSKNPNDGEWKVIAIYDFERDEAYIPPPEPEWQAHRAYGGKKTGRWFGEFSVDGLNQDIQPTRLTSCLVQGEPHMGTIKLPTPSLAYTTGCYSSVVDTGKIPMALKTGDPQNPTTYSGIRHAWEYQGTLMCYYTMKTYGGIETVGYYIFAGNSLIFSSDITTVREDLLYPSTVPVSSFDGSSLFTPDISDTRKLVHTQTGGYFSAFNPINTYVWFRISRGSANNITASLTQISNDKCHSTMEYEITYTATGGNSDTTIFCEEGTIITASVNLDSDVIWKHNLSHSAYTLSVMAGDDYVSVIPYRIDVEQELTDAAFSRNKMANGQPKCERGTYDYMRYVDPIGAYARLLKYGLSVGKTIDGATFNTSVLSDSAITGAYVKGQERPFGCMPEQIASANASFAVADALGSEKRIELGIVADEPWPSINKYGEPDPGDPLLTNCSTARTIFSSTVTGQYSWNDPTLSSLNATGTSSPNAIDEKYVIQYQHPYESAKQQRPSTVENSTTQIWGIDGALGVKIGSQKGYMPTFKPKACGIDPISETYHRYFIEAAGKHITIGEYFGNDAVPEVVDYEYVHGTGLERYVGYFSLVNGTQFPSYYPFGQYTPDVGYVGNPLVHDHVQGRSYGYRPDDFRKYPYGGSPRDLTYDAVPSASGYDQARHTGYRYDEGVAVAISRSTMIGGTVVDTSSGDIWITDTHLDHLVSVRELISQHMDLIDCSEKAIQSLINVSTLWFMRVSVAPIPDDLKSKDFTLTPKP